MTPKVGLYVGEGLPPNLARFLGSLRAAAADRFDVDVVGRRLPDIVPDGMHPVTVSERTTTRGLDELRCAYWDVRDYLGGHDPDAVWQVTAPHFHAVPTTVAARRADVPVATRIPGRKFSEHASAASRLESAKLFALNNVQLRATRFADAVVVLSEDNHRTMLSAGIPERKLVVLRPLLDTDRFAPPDPGEREALRRDLSMHEADHAVLYVGRLSRLKGMETLLAAVDELARTDVDVRFHVLGAGPYEDELAARDTVVLHGFVPPDEVNRYYKAADALCHPSHTEEEGISWTMLEAAATGLPVFARDVANAADAASFVFRDDAALAEHLATPSAWEPAPYPERWSLAERGAEYDDFLARLVER